MSNKKILTIIIVVAIVITILGVTFAYWTWSSTSAQKTNVTFTVGSNFSCGADGGGNIMGDKKLAPSDCTNTDYAVQRTITTYINNSSSDPVYMDMWLNVNSIGTYLSQTSNFKYALTTSSSSCTIGVVSEGTFQGKVANDKVQLLSGATSASTYYLYIWIDGAETNSTVMNESVSLSLGGECTNHNSSPYVYTANIYDGGVTGKNSVWLGSSISNNITQYSTPEAAMSALKTAGGGIVDYPFFLKHVIGDGTIWCAVKNADKHCIYAMAASCNGGITSDFGSGYTCQSLNYTEGVSESYVGFVVTPAMAAANQGMTAGTYYIRGGDNGEAYYDNKAVLRAAYGETRYCTQYSGYFACDVSGLYAVAYPSGLVRITGSNVSTGCSVGDKGFSYCYVGS